jgi:hypothetical protein
MINNGTSLCYLVVVVLSVIFLIWGFMDLLRQRQHHEATETQVISRQMRGLGLLLLSQVVLVLGAALCFGLGGGRSGLVRQMEMWR